MKTRLIPPLMLLAALSACVAPIGPVEVTRFHLPDISALGHGPVQVVAAPGVDPASLEFRSYAAAVSRRLVLLGYTDATGGQVAEVKIVRETMQPARTSSPVSVGIGGSTGSYGSGVGLGIGLNLSGPPPAQTRTDLAVTIRDHAGGQSLWEGRASFTVRSDSPLAGTQLGAAKLAEALFKGFPGSSGETIQVK